MKININDVKTFLAKKGYEWNGYIYDGNIAGIRPITEEELNREYSLLRLNVTANNKTGNKSFIINKDKFYEMAYHDYPMDLFLHSDWSNDWRKELLATKPGYAEYLTEWCKNTKNTIENNYKKSEENILKTLEEAKNKRENELNAVKFVENMLEDSLSK